MPQDLPTGWKLAEDRPTAAFPHTDERTEQCPTCRRWLMPRKDGKIRAHSRTLIDDLNRPYRESCPGSGAEDVRTFMVRALPVPGRGGYETRFTVTGRRSAEVIARSQLNDATVAAVEILEPAS